MSSILTNASAMTALQTLNMTNKNLAQTQSRIATGFKVSEAADNAAYWSIATTMRSDNKANAAIQDALGVGAGKVDTAYTAMNDSITVMDEIKTKLLSAKNASLEDQRKIASEITARVEHLKETVQSANYAGSNLLMQDGTADFEVISSYNRASDGTTSVASIKVSLASTQMVGVDAAGAADFTAGILADVTATTFFEIGAAATDPLDNATIDGFLGDLETALSAMATGAADLGAAKTRIDLQSNFIQNLSDAIDRGVGQLVDADMNAESARLSALQTQQQLGIQALSIANQNSQNILSLFR